MTEPLIPLNPCPFCGSEDVHLSEFHSYQHASCFACGGEGPLDLGNSGACEAWNTRPLEQQLLEACKKAYAILVIKYGSVSSPVGSLIGQLYAAIAAAEGSDQ